MSHEQALDYDMLPRTSERGQADYISVSIPSHYVEDLQFKAEPQPGNNYGMRLVISKVGPKAQRTGICCGDIIERVNGKAFDEVTLPTTGKLTLGVRRTGNGSHGSFTLDSNDSSFDNDGGNPRSPSSSSCALDSTTPSYQDMDAIAMLSNSSPSYSRPNAAVMAGVYSGQVSPRPGGKIVYNRNHMNENTPFTSPTSTNEAVKVKGKLPYSHVDLRKKTHIPDAAGGSSISGVGNLCITSVEEEISSESPLRCMPSAENVPVVPMHCIKPDRHSGVAVYRIQMKRWDYTRDVTIHSFEYRVHNEEEQTKHVTVEINGNDCVVIPSEGVTMAKTAETHSVSLQLGPMGEGSLCLIEPPLAGTRPGAFKSKLTVDALVGGANNGDETSEELKGVILTKTITQRNRCMTVAFNVQNTHKFCVFVAIKVKGDHDAARFSPELYVGPGATMAMGELVTGNKIHVTWTWREDKVVAAKVADFELKGVVLSRTLTPSANDSPGMAMFEVKNSNAYPVSVKIELKHSGGKSDTITGIVGAGETAKEFAKPLPVRGKITMKWKWAQHNP
eukprot:m.237091 g.237091  ORF g.237091 m.237091 type:complete len:561 (-) comp19362_c0_seq11:74-1756(-)